MWNLSVTMKELEKNVYYCEKIQNLTVLETSMMQMDLPLNRDPSAHCLIVKSRQKSIFCSHVFAAWEMKYIQRALRNLRTNVSYMLTRRLMMKKHTSCFVRVTKHMPSVSIQGCFLLWGCGRRENIFNIAEIKYII